MRIQSNPARILRASILTNCINPMIENLESRMLLSGTGGMTNIGETLLPAGVGAQYSATTDPTTGFGYFGSTGGNAPAVLSKVNLNGPTPVVVQDGSPTGIPSNVIGLLAVLIDTTSATPANHFLYVGCATGQILKLSPGDATHDPQVLAVLTPKSSFGNILCGAIDPAGGYAYFGVNASGHASVLRVQLSNFSDAGSETIPTPNYTAGVRMAAIDTIHHYLYFTSGGAGFAANSVIPFISKVNLATFTPGGSAVTLRLDSTTPGDGIATAGFDLPTLDETLVVDAQHGYAYIGTYNADRSPGTPKINTYPYDQSLVARIALGTGDAFPAHGVQTLTLPVGQRDLATAQLDAANGNLYIGTDCTYPAHVYEIHVGDGTTPMAETGVLNLNTVAGTVYPPDGDSGLSTPSVEGEIFLRSSILDVAQNAIYFGTDSEPGQIIKVGINGGVVGNGPAAPSQPQLAPGSDSGASGSDDITDVNTPTFIGSAEPGCTVSLFDGATLLGAVQADMSGNWTFTSSLLLDGVHSIAPTATDATGTSPPSIPLAVTIDTIPPAVPVFALDPAFVTPPLGNLATMLSVVTLSGSTETGAAVQLLQTGATTMADAGGDFHFAGVGLALGANVFTVQATDVAGNQSHGSATVTRLAQPTVPSISIGNATVVEPATGATPATFAVTLSAASTQTVTVAYATADGTGKAGVDYLATAGVLTFAPGIVMQTISVTVNHVVYVAPTETFTVNLSAPLNASLAAGQGIGTIIDSSPPGAGKIIFQSNRSGNMQIYTMNPDGSDLVQLTHDAFTDVEPRANFDGSEIVFASSKAGGFQIFEMDSTGQNLRQLTTIGAMDPCFSPDGTQIVFQSSGAKGQIYVMNSNGGNLFRVTNDAGNDVQPWFGTGGNIVFASDMNTPGRDQLYSIQSSGAGLTRLTSDSGSDFAPAVSPDGSHIVFESGRDGNAEIYLMPAAGGTQVDLTNNPAADLLPAFSPDGSHIIFVSARDGNDEIYTMDLTGGSLVRLTNNPAMDVYPFWAASPAPAGDGAAVVISHAQQGIVPMLQPVIGKMSLG